MTARILERSVAANVGSWLVHDRQHELDALTNPLKRKLGRGLLAFALAHPQAAERTLDRLASGQGYRYLGSGVEFSTYLRSSDNTAIKVHRNSAGQPQEKLTELVDEKKQGYVLLANYLGSTVLPQTVQVAEHVLGGNFQTVQIEQPFITFSDEDSPFRVMDTAVDPGRLENLVRNVPGIDDAFLELITRSRLMYDEKEQLPDTNGTNNIVAQPAGNLVLIDSSPIGSEHPGVQQLILDQLQSLEHGLREVA